MSSVGTKNASIDRLTYVPPLLPDYVSKAYNLKIIAGVPTSDEVAAIHDAIRALNGLCNSVPSLYNPKLSTQLSQHLFTVQMAVYRSEYPSSIFPSDNVYTPPSLPSQIPISLGTIVGPPTDEELDSAHRVVRAMENLANNPLFEYDSALNVKLSQHLFNIQFARYVQDSTQGTFAPKLESAQPSLPPLANEDEPPIVALVDLVNLVEPQEPGCTAVTTSDSNAPTGAQDLPQAGIKSGPVAISPSSATLDRFCNAQEETNRLLIGNEKLLSDIRRTLLSTQALHFSASSTYIPSVNQTQATCSAHSTMNDGWELPWMHDLPVARSNGSGHLYQDISEQQLVAYLKFYKIGSDLIEEGSGNLKPGKKEDARQRLASHISKGFSP